VGLGRPTSTATCITSLAARRGCGTTPTGGGAPAAKLSDADIARLHQRKNASYAELVRADDCPLRPGVERLILTSRARGLRLAICTTTSRVNIVELVEATLGAEGSGCTR